MKQHCRDVLAEAYLILDGEVVAEDRRIEIQTHLEECVPCLERYGLERHIKAIIHRLQGGTRCPAELRARIIGYLDEV
jgi:mycothiol system anti-sigma-R factor